MRRLAVLLFVASVMSLASSATARAQGQASECGSWRNPVLCKAELTRRGADGRWEAIDPSRTLTVPPGGSVDVELVGRDQFGRTFPQYRLGLGVGSRECSAMVGVENQGEGRLRLSARATSGRCRLDLWVPGNLNFEWRLEVEVARGPRSGYKRAEAELLARALYAALLEREPDAAGLSGAIAEIQRGSLEPQVSAMIRSAEFQQKHMPKGGPVLLDQFYRGFFGRSADDAGVQTFMADMQRAQWASVILRLARSPEFEERLARETR